MKKEIQELKNCVSELEEKVNTTVIQKIDSEILEWGKLADRGMDWKDAKEWCKEQGSGWRLPTVVEALQAYYDKIPGFGTGLHWTSDEYSESNARYVYFTDGDTTYGNKTYAYSVRCVRRKTNLTIIK